MTFLVAWADLGVGWALLRVTYNSAAPNDPVRKAARASLRRRPQRQVEDEVRSLPRRRLEVDPAAVVSAMP